MDFFETVQKRHSYRGQYEDTPIPEADLVKILDAGIRAPSGTNSQSTGFFMVTNKTLIKNIAELFTHNKENASTAPAIIVVVTKKIVMTYNDDGVDFELEDYGAAVQNLLLAITALGYASLWRDGECRIGNVSKSIARLLDVPEDMTVRTILPVGVPKKEGKQAPRKPFDERVTWKR